MSNTHAPPAHSGEIKVSFPADHVLLLMFNRPKSLNAMTPLMQHDINTLLNWFDSEPGLWIVIVTGEGRAFCAGADLVAWNKDKKSGERNEQERIVRNIHGFGSISRRSVSSKPMIAAVNGSAYGGGVELILNCDIVIASDDAVFALPEVKRGVLAAQGVIPRLLTVVGHQLASEILLLGRTVPALEARDRFHFVNAVVPKGEVVQTAVQWARLINENSPDAVQSTKRGLIIARGTVDEAVITHAWSPESKRAYYGENIKEGLRAFTEKRAPVWKNPAKL